MTIGTYLGFVAATVAIAAVPGVDHMYLGAVALRDGRAAGLVGALGMAASMCVHTAVSVSGLGLVVANAPMVFTAIKIIGGLYLIYLAVSAWRSSPDDRAAVDPGSRRTFASAFLVNLTNPKIVIFFLAFLPQFVSSGSGSVTIQLTALGLTFLVIGLLIDACYVMLFGAAGSALGRRGIPTVCLSRVAALVYLVLGVGILVAAVVTAVAGAADF
ncbi:putative amino acid efflux protein [Gordonia soli NBRC 108243]|uniref:Putative amino acid efflux protein n=1 Tax=Gordonia soli NBRC 108243 TaxID=1223545 RepID=M0QCQ7_9ACTN|nr:putative amino acid efflux protein [Gordonia soli NBRC 108243]